MYRCLPLLLLFPVFGCGAGTYYPQSSMPAYGEGGEWQECSGQVAPDLTGGSMLAVENTLTEPVDLIWVDEACAEQLLAEIDAGGLYEAEHTNGQVFAVRGQENGFLYHHFKLLGHYDVVVP